MSGIEGSEPRKRFRSSVNNAARVRGNGTPLRPAPKTWASSNNKGGFRCARANKARLSSTAVVSP